MILYVYIGLSALVALVVYAAISTIMLHKRDKLPGPPTKWLTNLDRVGPDKVENTLQLDVEYSGLFRVYFAPWAAGYAVWMSHPKYVKPVLKGSSPKMMDVYFPLVPWLGSGLLLASGKRWGRSRRLLTPAFHFDILKPYMDVYNEAADTLVNIWSKRLDDGYFDIVPEISRMTLDVILRCAMSSESECQTEVGKNPYVGAVTDVSFLAMDRAANPLHRSDFIYKWSSNGRKFAKALAVLHSQSEQVIHDRRMALEDVGEHQATTSKKYRDFLDILLTARDEAGVGLTDKEIRDEVDTFMFEGHDTTAHGILWTLYCLGQNPEHQQRCRDEVDGILGDLERDLTWDDMDKLEYTHRCVREAMRLFPPVPVIGRKLTEDTTCGDYVLPGGTNVIVSLIGLHRCRESFEDPLEYRPSRFSTEEMKNRDAFAYVPFSAGPRNCIGQVFASHEEKITVAKILRKFVVETNPDHKIKLHFGLVLRSATGIQIRLKEREL